MVPFVRITRKVGFGNYLPLVGDPAYRRSRNQTRPPRPPRTHYIGGFTLFDRTVSLAFASAAALWIAGFGLILANLFGAEHMYAHLGLGLCCGGAVLMIRSMMCQAVRHLEQTVFELGRDAGRAEAGSVPLQRVH